MTTPDHTLEVRQADGSLKRYDVDALVDLIERLLMTRAAWPKSGVFQELMSVIEANHYCRMRQAR